MEQNLPATIALLSRTPAALDALLRGLSEEWTHRPESEGSWTIFEVLAHLVSAERVNFLPRARMILDHGESQPFPPFQRAGNSGDGKTLGDLLDEFASLRAANLDTLRSWNLQPGDFAKRGIHPTFGPVTLSQQLATWATHDMTHLHQISRILASQYREAVGPWTTFLGVLKCNGHSD